MDKEKKKKIIKYSLIGFFLLLLFIFTLFLLNFAKRKNYDIEVLSGVNYLKADLANFYMKYNMYPLEIKDKSLVLENLNIKYLACEREGGDCGSDNLENPKAYRFVYSLKSGR